MGKRSHWETARWSIIAKTLVFQGRKLHQKRVTAWQRFIAELLNSNNRPSSSIFFKTIKTLWPMILVQTHWRCFKCIQNTWQFGSHASSPLFCNKSGQKLRKNASCVHGVLIVVSTSKLNLKAYLQSSNNTITRCDRCNNEDFEHVSDANLGWVTPIFTCQSFGKSGNPQPKRENMSLQGTGCKPIGKKLLYLAFVKRVSRFFSTSDG